MGLARNGPSFEHRERPLVAVLEGIKSIPAAVSALQNPFQYRKGTSIWDPGGISTVTSASLNGSAWHRTTERGRQKKLFTSCRQIKRSLIDEDFNSCDPPKEELELEPQEVSENEEDSGIPG
ncbi:unnamed protein product [Lampetra fluviatilis]